MSQHGGIITQLLNEAFKLTTPFLSTAWMYRPPWLRFAEVWLIRFYTRRCVIKIIVTLSQFVIPYNQWVWYIITNECVFRTYLSGSDTHAFAYDIQKWKWIVICSRSLTLHFPRMIKWLSIKIYNFSKLWRCCLMLLCIY